MKRGPASTPSRTDRLSHPLRRVGDMELGGSTMSRQERVGRESQDRVSALVGQSNVLAAQLVDVVVEVLDAEAWGGGEGLRSPEHWLSWRAGLSASRARGIVPIARRVAELPRCVGLDRKRTRLNSRH